MLVLTRKSDEGITLQLDGQVIHLTIIDVQGSKPDNKQVRIGIDAPQACRIARDELLWAEATNRAAAASDLPEYVMPAVAQKVTLARTADLP